MSLVLYELLLGPTNNIRDELYLEAMSFAAGGSPTAIVPAAVKAGDFIVVYSTVGRAGSAATNTATPAGYTNVFPNLSFTAGLITYSTKTYAKVATGAEAGTSITTYTGGVAGSIRIMVFRRTVGVISTVTYLDQQRIAQATVPAALTTVNSAGKVLPAAYFIFASVNSAVSQDIQYTITNPLDYFFIANEGGRDCHLYGVKSFPVGDTPQNNTYKLNTTTGANVYTSQHFFIEYT